MKTILLLLVGCAAEPTPTCDVRTSCTMHAFGHDFAGICELDAGDEPTCFALCDATSLDPCGQGGASAMDDSTCFCPDLEGPV